MEIAHAEQVTTIKETIQAKVNGKIDDFRKDQNLVNEAQNKILEAQNKTLEEIKLSMAGPVSVYKGSSGFFTGAKTGALWVTAIASACVAVWAFIKLVVFNALN